MLLILNSFLPAEADLTRLRVHDDLPNRFKIPASFWRSVAQESNGLFGWEDHRNVDGSLESFSK